MARAVFWRTHYLAAHHTTCRTARRVARRFFSQTEGNAEPNPVAFGYRCLGTRTRNGPGFACRKGRRQVRWLSQSPDSVTARATISGGPVARAAKPVAVGAWNATGDKE